MHELFTLACRQVQYITVLNNDWTVIGIYVNFDVEQEGKGQLNVGGLEHDCGTSNRKIRYG
jgi:hypothetical protein